MTSTEMKELFYLRLLPADELADQICCLPHTLIESIIETALKDEDGMFDILTDTFGILKKNIDIPYAKKALRKFLKISQILGCTGYFDFGDWEEIRNDESMAADIEPQEIEDVIDLSIKEFPERADKKDKEMLNKLAKSFTIDRIMTNNKFNLMNKSYSKRVVRSLLENGYAEGSGPIFMKLFINYSVEDEHIHSYFRQCKKDIPL